MDKQIWLGMVELEYTPEQSSSRVKRGFISVTTWAGDYEEFCSKAQEMIEHYGWKLLRVENARVISEEEEFSDVVEGMVARTRTIPSAVLSGTIHAYAYYVN